MPRVINRAIRTKGDIIKFYFERYRFYRNNIGLITDYGTLITQKLVDITLKRLIELMENEWEGIFGEQEI
jgi:hypothetical protein